MRKYAAAAVLAAALSGCGGEKICPQDQVSCGGSCTAVTTDPRSCGACGHACAEGQVCTAGACASATAVDCGAPGRTCGSRERCVGGLCVADLYVACFNTNEVREATQDLEPAGTPIATDAGSVALAWSVAPSTRLYAVNSRSLSLSEIRFDAAAASDECPTGVCASSMKLFSGPTAPPGADAEFAAASGGLVFVSSASASSLLVVSGGAVADEVPLAQADGVQMNPQGIAFSSGKVYVALNGGTPPAATVAQEIAVLAPSGACPACYAVQSRIGVQALADANGFARPFRMAAVGTKLYVTLENLDPEYRSAGNVKLAVIDTERDALDAGQPVIDLGPSCQGTASIDVLGSTLFVTCSYSQAIVPVDLAAAPPAPGAAISTAQFDPPFGPGSIAMCRRYGYVGDMNSGRVLRFDPAGGLAAATSQLCPQDAQTHFGWAADVKCGP